MTVQLTKTMMTENARNRKRKKWHFLIDKPPSWPPFDLRSDFIYVSVCRCRAARTYVADLFFRSINHDCGPPLKLLIPDPDETLLRLWKKLKIMLSFLSRLFRNTQASSFEVIETFTVISRTQLAAVGYSPKNVRTQCMAYYRSSSTRR